MYQTRKVLRQTEICKDVYSMEILTEDMAAQSQPGQFVMIKSWEGIDPFLMRPISINSVDRERGTLTLLYKRVGKGTGLLAKQKDGGAVTVLGPLGKGFPIPRGARRVAILGRGIGIAPLRFLLEECRRQGIEVCAYLSAKSSDFLFHQAYFQSLGAVVQATTDPNENVADRFAADAAKAPFDAAYSCGSNRLARAMKAVHQQYEFPAYVSLEEHMACGIGACKGCVCTAYEKADCSEQYVRVCKSGPVFDVERVVK